MSKKQTTETARNIRKRGHVSVVPPPLRDQRIMSALAPKRTHSDLSTSSSSSSSSSSAAAAPAAAALASLSPEQKAAMDSYFEQRFQQLQERHEAEVQQLTASRRAAEETSQAGVFAGVQTQFEPRVASGRNYTATQYQKAFAFSAVSLSMAKNARMSLVKTLTAPQQLVRFLHKFLSWSTHCHSLLFSNSAQHRHSSSARCSMTTTSTAWCEHPVTTTS